MNGRGDAAGVREQHWKSGGHGLSHGVAVAFYERGHHEQIGCGEGGEFFLVLEHPGESDITRNAEALRECAQPRFVIRLGGAD